MSWIEERSIELRDGSRLRVRTPTGRDVEGVLAYRRRDTGTSPHQVTQVDELETIAAEEAQRLESWRDKPNSLALIAEIAAGPDAGRVVGTLDFRGHRQRRLAHHGMFGVGVEPEWRGRGVGRALIAALVDWARAHATIEIVRLGVFATNERAIQLYRSMGFIETGRTPRFFKLEDGAYIDDVQMALSVKAARDRA